MPRKKPYDSSVASTQNPLRHFSFRYSLRKTVVPLPFLLPSPEAKEESPSQAALRLSLDLEDARVQQAALLVDPNTTPQRISEIENFKKETLLLDHLRMYCADFVIQLELTGTDNYHYQGYLHTIDPVRPITLARIFNDAGFRGSQISPASSVARATLRTYCLKADTRIAGPWTAKKVYRGLDLLCVRDTPYPFQVKLHTMLRSPHTDNRAIIWLYSPVGNRGFSSFAKYYSFFKLGVTLSPCSATDFKYLCAEFPSNIYLVDIARSAIGTYKDDEFYSALREVKNGFYTSTKKSKCRNITRAIPHIVVTANFLPDFSKLSADRWTQVFQLTDNSDMHLYVRPTIPDSLSDDTDV